MVEVTNTIEQDASERVANKARACYVRKLAVDRYLVTPRKFDRTRRLVTFRLRQGRMLASCVDNYDGTACPANQHGLLCYHVLRSIQHCERLARQEIRRAA